MIDDIPFLGFGLGHPGILNMVGGSHFDAVTVKMLAGYGVDYYGFQGGVTFNIFDSDDNNFTLGIGVCAGYWHDKDFAGSYTYYGPSLNLLWSGFVLELAIGNGLETVKHSAPDDEFLILNLGYVYRFDLRL